MNIYEVIANELEIKEDQVVNTVKLIDEGNTIPFISRYRKEVTGNLDDSILRNLEERLKYLRNLEDRKKEILKSIDEQGKLTEELEGKILGSIKLQEVEDLYLPYRPKRRTRGSMARERGLEELAEKIYKLEIPSYEEFLTYAENFVDPEKEVENLEAAIAGAKDIIAEDMAETIEFRNIVRRRGNNNGILSSELIEENIDKTYEIYFEFSERVSKLRPHNILALFRGEKEKVLRLKFDLQDEINISEILINISKDRKHPLFPLLEEAVEDGYKRLLLPSIETEIRNNLKEYADLSSIEVFKGNLEPYLLQPPIKDRVVMALDPGFRTGCKVAVISEFGEYLDDDVVFVTEPFENKEKASRILRNFVEKYNVSLIAIGNGTASRETESFVADFVKTLDREVLYTIVNEAGASIYSASKIGDEEFPDLDTTVRGAISIGRRIQDPLAELVKIEPQHIGVGQYQHDINQVLLRESLENVVESCVNNVGVNINTASLSLLNYVAGISKRVAQNILDYKKENGPFLSRNDIKNVKGLGPKTFLQCAGFLRIPESDEILDNTGVHPESYKYAKKLEGMDLNQIDTKALSQELEVGELTLIDIIEELKRPGRDPREEMPKPILRSDVLTIDDLEIGMELRGTVRNIVDFGAFIDIGLENDALVHISQIAEKFIKHPSDVLKVTDTVNVKILNIDKEKGRIGLTMKGLKQ